MTAESSDRQAGLTDVFAALRRHVSEAEIPASCELMSAGQLAARLENLPRYDLLLLGDVMLGDKLARRIEREGAAYPCAGVLPLLRKSVQVVANLEAPFAHAPREATERFSYRVPPNLVEVLKRGGISGVNLANNHILDCGREGVIETLETLADAGIGAFGAGRNQGEARQPLILRSGGLRIGFVGYYWNPRCAATAILPGAASSDPVCIEAAIGSLRPQVDLLVACFHWGDTYRREPTAKARLKARLAIDAGADVVVGHHPHVIQPMEVHAGRPIFYSIGNFLMGSGNSRAEGLALGLRYDSDGFRIDAFPLYVKNRDPRVDYQSKALAGNAARLLAERLGCDIAFARPSDSGSGWPLTWQFAK